MELAIKIVLAIFGLIAWSIFTLFIMVIGCCLCILSPFIALSFIIGFIKADDFYSSKLWTPWNGNR
jgi:multisubunit Na+/H+ antiporter MnhG subunit